MKKWSACEDMMFLLVAFWHGNHATFVCFSRPKIIICQYYLLLNQNRLGVLKEMILLSIHSLVVEK